MECTSYFLLSNGKHNITSLSLLVGATVHVDTDIALHDSVKQPIKYHNSECAYYEEHACCLG